MAIDTALTESDDIVVASDLAGREREARILDLTRSLLEAIGEDTARPGLERTPERVARAWEFLTAGYRTTVEEVLNGARFPAESEGLVVVHDIAFASLCEHHLLPFYGKVHIGYVPDGTILGLSKLARITDVFARRLQVQERMTAQIADALMGAVSPLGAGVVVEAEHMCMVMRGVEKPGAVTTTTSMVGTFRDKRLAHRDEFFATLRRRRP